VVISLKLGPCRVRSSFYAVEGIYYGIPIGYRYFISMEVQNDVANRKLS
jgi:hypothetical protein